MEVCSVTVLKMSFESYISRLKPRVSIVELFVNVVASINAQKTLDVEIIDE